MDYVLHVTTQPKCTFSDDGFSIGKHQYNYSDVRGVSLFSKPTALTNGVIQININGKLINAAFPKKQESEGLAVYDYLQKVVADNERAEKEAGVSFETAEELYDYCISHSLGSGFNKKWGLKHFQIIIDNLMNGEHVIFPFIGFHNYVSSSKHDGYFAYAVTNKRILMGQKKAIGQTFQSVSWQNINDITFSTSALMGVITIDTFKETFNVGVNKMAAQNINSRIHEVLEEVKHPSENSNDASASSSTSSPYDDLKKLKELLDMGVITQEDFDAKKKQLLDL